MAASGNDNLTTGIGDLYRRKGTVRRPARARKKAPRPRSSRNMALDPFFVGTLVLLGCAAVMQVFLIVWLEFV